MRFSGIIELIKVEEFSGNLRLTEYTIKKECRFVDWLANFQNSLIIDFRTSYKKSPVYLYRGFEQIY
jgi:hypothetical protein